MFIKKIIPFVLLLFSFSADQLFGCWSLVHIYLAQRFADTCFPDWSPEERESFLRGSILPDIRRAADLSRGSTHFSIESVKQVIDGKKCIISGATPFEMGIRHHNFVDVKHKLRAE
ncbi:hypothetical protein KAU11_00895 [Candidatus Babeliales bacterium]|nr:hypothetical protein [Candidatus Babeliales bacterium]